MKKKLRVLVPAVPELVEYELCSAARKILATGWVTVYVAANTAMVEAYRNIGREIVER